MRTISYLAAELDILLSVNDDLLLPTDRDNLCSAVRIARMVDQPSTTPASVSHAKQ